MNTLVFLALISGTQAAVCGTDADCEVAGAACAADAVPWVTQASGSQGETDLNTALGLDATAKAALTDDEKAAQLALVYDASKEGCSDGKSCSAQLDASGNPTSTYTCQTCVVSAS